MSDEHAQVEQLHQILKNAHVRDAEIRGGVRLSANGYSKLSRQMGGISTQDIDHLLLVLARKLDEDGLNESAHARYTYEDDFLHNVTIRDGKTGDENYFGGSEAMSLMDELEGLQYDAPQAQEILGHWMHRMSVQAAGQALVEAAGRKQSNFASEIKNETGSYNFPWRIKGKFGTATAAYTGEDDDFRLKVVDVRDQNGEEMPMTPDFMKLLKSQALDFIGEE